MPDNPNLITQLRADHGTLTWRYHGWSARLRGVNDHAIRLTVTTDGRWPSQPTLPSKPTVENHGDQTVATGGTGQRYEAPIITTKAHQALTLKQDTLVLGNYTLKFAPAGSLLISRADHPVVTVGLPQLTEAQWHLRLRGPQDAVYFGGGTQIGRVSLNGQLISVKNENRWTPGGVASPVPFFWSTSGYGILANTFTPGEYDFSNPRSGVDMMHEDPVCDLYLLLGETPTTLIHTYHELTGKPILPPRFSFYPGHFNAYNRDYWVPVMRESPGARLFPDGQWYKEYQPIAKATFNTGYRAGTITIGDLTLVPNVSGDGPVVFTEPNDAGLPTRAFRESLNGETDPQFSARSVIDRYAAAEIPLGWLIPNDGYGAGYGQTKTFAGDLANLTSFSVYAAAHGITTGLWTQAKLTPRKPDRPQKGERDLSAELQTAKVKALKTDVAWVGEGYTFGLNAADRAAAAMKAAGLRPFVVTLDGWAGTQRDAVVWTGDQAGSDWQNIATHIASYLATGLSGNPNVASDIDGIYAGSDPVIQTRDLQWKAFTPHFFAMDGWGDQPKDMGLSFGEPYVSINRQFLRYHTQLVPFLYSLAAEAQTTGAPVIRPTWWQEATPYTLTHLTDQFMVGDALLIAPLTSAYGLQPNGDGVRPHCYLPAGEWTDFWTGQHVSGGRTLADITTPLAQLPIYVRSGAILPLAAPHQNPAQYSPARHLVYYPGPASHFTLSEDDGATLAYQTGAQARTSIEAQATATDITLTIHPTTGHYDGVQSVVTTTVFIPLTNAPQRVALTIDQQPTKPAWHYGPRTTDAFGRTMPGVTVTLPALPIQHTTITLHVQC